jgi:RNA polymerase sigma factor (TIGR02999 family)
MPSVEHTTLLLLGVRAGDQDARRQLFELAYGELRALAGALFRQQPSSHTLQPTALVHELWAKLAVQTSLQVRDRAHFMAIAATAMRQLLIDHARARNAEKRGAGAARVAIEEAGEPFVGGAGRGGGGGGGAGSMLDVLALDEALSKLMSRDHRQGRVVELRVFGGLSVAEVAEALDVSHRTVELDWRMARAWLSRELGEGGAEAPGA